MGPTSTQANFRPKSRLPITVAYAAWIAALASPCGSSSRVWLIDGPEHGGRQSEFSSTFQGLHGDARSSP